MFALPLIVVTVLLASPAVYGHARLRDPPARTSAFHLGFPNVPPEYSDFQLNCGGYEVLINRETKSINSYYNNQNYFYKTVE